MCCFEGMKAYHGADGRMRLFRPDQNMARLLRSARRLQLADFDPEVCCSTLETRLGHATIATSLGAAGLPAHLALRQQKTRRRGVPVRLLQLCCFLRALPCLAVAATRRSCGAA